MIHCAIAGYRYDPSFETPSFSVESANTIPNTQKHFLQQVFSSTAISYGPQNYGVEETSVLSINLTQCDGVTLL